MPASIRLALQTQRPSGALSEFHHHRLRFIFLKLIEIVENAYLMFLKGTMGSPTVHFAPIWLLHTVLLRHVKAPWTMQESPIYHHVDGSLLYQNPLSTNSVIFLINSLIHFSRLLYESLEIS